MICCIPHQRQRPAVSGPFAFGLKNQLRPMAKIELLRVPVVGWLLSKAGIFGVDRGKSDVGALKQAMQFLRSGEKVLIFPEGHRVRESRGDVSQPKAGAAMLAVRCGVPHPAGLHPREKALVPPHAGGHRRGLHPHCGHPEGDAGGVRGHHRRPDEPHPRPAGAGRMKVELARSAGFCYGVKRAVRMGGGGGPERESPAICWDRSSTTTGRSAAWRPWACAWPPRRRRCRRARR